jgi:hypothetical protein
VFLKILFILFSFYGFPYSVHFPVERWQKTALLVFQRWLCVSAKTKCAVCAWAFLVCRTTFLVMFSAGLHSVSLSTESKNSNENQDLADLQNPALNITCVGGSAFFRHLEVEFSFFEGFCFHLKPTKVPACGLLTSQAKRLACKR